MRVLAGEGLVRIVPRWGTFRAWGARAFAGPAPPAPAPQRLVDRHRAAHVQVREGQGQVFGVVGPHTRPAATVGSLTELPLSILVSA